MMNAVGVTHNRKSSMPSGKNDHVQESLPDVLSHLLEECRMVLPGLQALFGFQLIAVFNEAFWQRLGSSEQLLHLLALALIAVAVALVMTPAAYHRQAAPESVSRRLIILSSRLLLWSMFPLMVAIGIDVYIVSQLILQHTAVSVVVTVTIVMLYVVPWFLLPRAAILQRWLQR